MLNKEPIRLSFNLVSERDDGLTEWNSNNDQHWNVTVGYGDKTICLGFSSGHSLQRDKFGEAFIESVLHDYKDAIFYDNDVEMFAYDMDCEYDEATVPLAVLTGNKKKIDDLFGFGVMDKILFMTCSIPMKRILKHINAVASFTY